MKLVICEQDICKIHAKRLTSKQTVITLLSQAVYVAVRRTLTVISVMEAAAAASTDCSKLELASMTLVSEGVHDGLC